MEERKEDLRPLILLDGHQTRFELEFLSYVNNPDHCWSSYGTATEQNGTFKMSMNRMKEFLLQKQIATMANVDLVPTDIIPLINYAWEHSLFIRIQSNKRAICNHGWYPLNRNLLLELVL
jgi:hypothetical protein